MLHDLARRGFEAAGERYDRGRPDYPAEGIAWLVDKLGLGPGARVLDLAAGTGKLTAQIAASGADVAALEPVAGMREQLLRRLPGVELVDGTAERMALEPASVDAVVVGQAFHWFDGPAALREIRRVMRPDGGLGLIWNLRDEREPWVAELSSMIHELDPGSPHYKGEEWRAVFESDAAGTAFGPIAHRRFAHEQVGDIDTVLDRVASVSYVAAAPSGERDPLLADVRALLESDRVPRLADGSVSLPYVTDAYVTYAIEPNAVADAPVVAARVSRVGRVVQVSVSPGGVPKRRVESAWVDRLGVAGDRHTEPEPMHGGPEQAVCIYSVEAIRRVAADGHEASPGAFGENLTLEGIELGTLGPGDRLEVGNVGLVLEVTKRAAPCQTIAHFFAGRRIARISPKTRPEDARWYARVVAEGRVAEGDDVRVAGAMTQRAATRRSPSQAAAGSRTNRQPRTSTPRGRPDETSMTSPDEGRSRPEGMSRIVCGHSAGPTIPSTMLEPGGSNRRPRSTR